MNEKNSNSHRNNIVVAFKAAGVYAMVNVPKTYLIIACNHFRQRVEADTAVTSGSSKRCHPSCMWSPVENVELKSVISQVSVLV